MPIYLDDKTLLHAPNLSLIPVPGAIVALDPQKPNWISSDERGVNVLTRFDGRTPFGEIVAEYAAKSGLDVAQAWLHVETFARDALRQGFVSVVGADSVPYLGRSAYLTTDRLEELWIQVNDFCNLACEHCLVSSNPDGGQGLEGAQLVDIIDQAVELGVKRYFFTGGEPLARPDIFDLCRRAMVTHSCELVILTNGTLLTGERIRRLGELVNECDKYLTNGAQANKQIASRLRIQVSLDGYTKEINDPIRGNGSFERIIRGIDNALSVGLRLTLTTTILDHNLHALEGMIRLAALHGVSNVHLLWPHRRGRILDGPFSKLPSAEAILLAVRRAQKVANKLGISIDNIDEFRLRMDGAPGIKNDLAGAGWNSLCVNTDGCIYPSASMSGVPEVLCGDLTKQSLEDIWKESSICCELRQATVERKPICRTCSIKFLCGGGDVEHGYWASAGKEGSGTKGSFVAHDPYCDLYKGLAVDVLANLTTEGRHTIQTNSGFDRPVVFRGMGEYTFQDEEAVVRTTHSACVLSAELVEKSRFSVREFYGQAAVEPQAELCCPVSPDEEDLAHIPKEVIERFYGCGSPVAAAALAPGETMVDLGSGAGIDCFIAAKKVGTEGRVYGIDMTDQMLSVARGCQSKVAEALGYEVVEFRHGYLEEIPLEDKSADLVTSNCVINLSPDKSRVFREIWRVLRDHGRVVIADIVSDRAVPPPMRMDGKLWGECISGALTEEAFLALLERSGFYGITILKKSFWKNVQGCNFSSVTVRGYKFEKKAGCHYIGQHAVYLGPMKVTIDEEGHLFPRGTSVEVCTDTAAKLSCPPYAGSFVITGSDDGERESTASDESCCTSNDGCC